MTKRRPASYPPYERRKHQAYLHAPLCLDASRWSTRRKKATTTTRPNVFTTVTMAPNDDKTASTAGGVQVLFFLGMFSFFISFWFYFTDNYLRTGMPPTNNEITKKGPKRQFVLSFTLQVSFFCFSLSCKLTNVFYQAWFISRRKS